MAETIHVLRVSCIIILHPYEPQNLSVQPDGVAALKPDSSIDETTTLTDQVIATFLSKMTESSSSDGSSHLLSAIEQAPGHE
jgi:hypothetical protein